MVAKRAMNAHAVLSWLLLTVSTAGAAESVKLLPEQFTLTGSEARQSLVLEVFADTKATGQVTEGVTFTSSDPAVVKIESGVAIGVGNGKATITAASGERKATAEVTVADMDKPFEWSFRTS